MNRLVRARTKPVEQLPEWAVCCESQRVNMARPDKDFVVNLDSIFENDSICQFCERCEPDVKYVHGIDCLPLALDWLDLDEGPLETGHIQAGD